jgi:hypothetical protein
MKLTFVSNVQFDEKAIRGEKAPTKPNFKVRRNIALPFAEANCVQVPHTTPGDLRSRRQFGRMKRFLKISRYGALSLIAFTSSSFFISSNEENEEKWMFDTKVIDI